LITFFVSRQRKLYVSFERTKVPNEVSQTQSNEQ
jgi:hypothetical protein